MGSFLIDILEFVILALFLRAMARGLGSVFRSPGIRIRTSWGEPQPPPSATQHTGEMARDPLCGMFVSTELSHQLKQGRDTLHFCSRECLEKYRKNADHVAS
jgi:YHS domain-containing protein